MTRSKHTVIFWGAGATASLGIQTTAAQTRTLHSLAFADNEQKPLAERIGDALGDKRPWTLFGATNVRYYGGGIPDVFLDGGSVTDSAVDRLLTWEHE